jgi:hypothetical protein
MASYRVSTNTNTATVRQHKTKSTITRKNAYAKAFYAQKLVIKITVHFYKLH